MIYIIFREGICCHGLLCHWKSSPTVLVADRYKPNSSVSILQLTSQIILTSRCSYLETGGADLTIRPWFWILCLFLGPTFSGLLFQWYIFIATRALTHTEALITQLVFEHSLRIRLVAETNPDIGPGGGQNIPSAEPLDTDSVTSSDESTECSTEGLAEVDSTGIPTANKVSAVSDDSQSTITAAATPSKGKDRGTSVPTGSTKLKPELEATRKKDANLVGKINNLVTTDLGNIVSARDFLFLSESNCRA